MQEITAFLQNNDGMLFILQIYFSNNHTTHISLFNNSKNKFQSLSPQVIIVEKRYQILH